MIKLVKLNSKRIKKYLEDKRRQIERRIATLKREDPFNDETRLSDNAASDTEAREEIGHERVEALKIETVAQLTRVKKSLSKIGIGKYGYCDNCREPIASNRLKVFPMAEYCLACEREREKR